MVVKKLSPQQKSAQLEAESQARLDEALCKGWQDAINFVLPNSIEVGFNSQMLQLARTPQTSYSEEHTYLKSVLGSSVGDHKPERYWQIYKWLANTEPSSLTPDIVTASFWLRIAAHFGSLPALDELAKAFARSGNTIGSITMQMRAFDAAETGSSSRYSMLQAICAESLKLSPVDVNLDWIEENLRSLLSAADKWKESSRKDLLTAYHRLFEHVHAGRGVRIIRSLPDKSGDFDPGRYAGLLLPMKARSATYDLREKLEKEFPWCHPVIDKVLRNLCVQKAFGQSMFRMRPTLLVGPQGTGKTHFVKRFAELAGIPCREFSLAGMTDNRVLAGTGRGWSSARPSEIVAFIANSGCPNPIVILDELDKLSKSRRNGSIFDTLLALTEPRTSKSFVDEALLVPCDLSLVNYIATANILSTIPRVLLSRFEIIMMPEAKSLNVEVILAGIRRTFAENLNIHEEFLPRFDGHDFDLLEAVFNQAGIRRMKMAAEDLLSQKIGNAQAEYMSPRRLH